MTTSQDERGSVLMLVPAGILVLLLLAAIAIDGAVVWLAQRDLANRAAAVATDIAGAAVDDPTFYGDGDVRLRADAAATYADLVFSADRLPAGYEGWDAEVVVAGRAVSVDARAEVRYVFASAIPGLARTAEVRARATAEAQG